MRSPWMRRAARVVVGVAGLLALLVAGVAAADCATAGPVDAARQARVERSPQWRDGRFHNPEAIWLDESGAILSSLAGTPAGVPEGDVPVADGVADALARPPRTGLRVTWFGHSSALVEIDGVRVLTDPVWSERPSPVSWAGPARWFAPVVPLSGLPGVDAVVISHDHYDHLDRPTVEALARTGTTFVVSLGNGAHLARWGVPKAQVVELDWWESTSVGGVEIVATPARHATGRVNPRASRTLWAGYALRGPRHRAWYSGDTGFFPALEEIGRRLGPFDVTLIESGQYDAHWPDMHLGPEQAVDAHRLVRGRTMVPVHWALFKLANHGWTEPVERVLAAASCVDADILAPRPGQPVEPTLPERPARWWPASPWRTAAERPIASTLDGDPAHRVPALACLPAVSSPGARETATAEIGTATGR